MIRIKIVGRFIFGIFSYSTNSGYRREILPLTILGGIYMEREYRSWVFRESREEL